MLAAAEAWNSLSTEYAAVADELSALLGQVRAGVWEGPSAESYVAANVPYLAWLEQASADSAAAAASHETAAAAYAAALAAMPTLGELAANHATHAALAATNFFGINTIPIALNEADYVRMWVQAATTMGTYHAVSAAAVTSTPRTAPAPPILKADTGDDAASKSSGSADSNTGGLGQLVTDLYQAITGESPPPASLPDTGLVGQVGNAFYQTYLGIFKYLPESLSGAHNPSAVISVLLTFAAQFVYYRVMELIQILSTLQPYLLSAALGSAIADLGAITSLGAAGGVGVTSGLGAASGLAGLSGLAAVATGPIPVAAGPTPMPNIGVSPTLGAATPTAPAPVSAAAPAAGAPAPPPTGAAAPPPTGAPPPPTIRAEGFAYMVGGIPAAARSSTSAKTKEPAPDPAAAPSSAGAASVQGKARARLRRRRATLKDRGFRHEFVDPEWDTEPEPDTLANDAQQATSATASDQGAGPLGFFGTARENDATQAAGLATLNDDRFTGGPTVPMMPGSWGQEPY